MNSGDYEKWFHDYRFVLENMLWKELIEFIMITNYVADMVYLLILALPCMVEWVRKRMVLLMSMDYLNVVEIPRYLSYLLGFIVVMYGAVQASGLIFLYMHWELLGVFSYLLVEGQAFLYNKTYRESFWWIWVREQLFWYILVWYDLLLIS